MGRRKQTFSKVLRFDFFVIFRLIFMKTIFKNQYLKGCLIQNKTKTQKMI